MSMPSDLLILHSGDSQHLVDTLRAQLSKSTTITVIRFDNYQFPLRPSSIQNFSKSKLQIVFFSFELLKFLESKPEEAFSICKLFDPISTFAVFSPDIRECNVLCYHKAPLLSYDSWQKFYIPNGSNKGSGIKLPALLLQRIRELECEVNNELKAGDVLLVPEIIRMDQKDIYLIFKNALKNTNAILVKSGYMKINDSTVKVNPYVLKFQMPEFLIQNPGSIEITVHYHDKIVLKKKLQILCRENRPTSHNRISTKTLTNYTEMEQEMALNEQLDFLANFPFLSDANADDDSITEARGESPTNTPEHDTEDESTQSLIEICEKYGLKELSLEFLNDGLVQERENTLKSGERTLVAGDSRSKDGEHLPQVLRCPLEPYFADESENRRSSRVGQMRRSLSLPSTLLQVDMNLNSFVDYLDMSCKTNWNGELKPHETLLKESTEDQCDSYNYITCSISSHEYISMKLSKGDETERSLQKNGLSGSQQELLELMQAFKRGTKTMSQVEQHFKEWHKRHRHNSDHRDFELRNLKLEYEKTKKRLSFGLPDLKSFILRKPKKSKEKSFSDDTNKPKFKSKSPDTANKRSSKISDSSVSSGSSGTTEVFTNWRFQNPGTTAPCARAWYPGPIPAANQRVYCPGYPNYSPPPPPPSRPPPERHGFPHALSYSEQCLLLRPVPLPRKKIGIVPPMPLQSPDYLEPIKLSQRVSRSQVELHTGKDDNVDPNSAIQQHSPDYIIPVNPRFFSSNRNKTTLPKNSSPIKLSNTETSPGVSTHVNRKQTDIPILPRRKTSNGAMFYITRRCSSFPELNSIPLDQPIYMELITSIIERRG